MAAYIRCNGPLWRPARCNAATAHRGWCWLPKPSWTRIPLPPVRKLWSALRGTSAAARGTSELWKLWKRLRRGDAVREFSVIGKSLPRIDAAGKVSGQTRYAGDLSLPRQLWCKLVRSPHPHARILRIDAARARALEGVAAVLTGADLSTRYGILPVSQDEEALCTEKVRYVGDPVAAVAAVDEAIAERAAALVAVDYEPLPGIFSIEDALRGPGEPIHVRGNVQKTIALEFGDVAAGFGQASYTREDLFFYDGST